MSSPVQRRPELTGWQVHLSKVPVAVNAADPAWPAEDRGVLNNLAGALAYGFDAVRGVWEQAHGGYGVTGYRIQIGAVPDGPALSVQDATIRDSVVMAILQVDAVAFPAAAHADIRAAQAMMATLSQMSSGVPGCRMRRPHQSARRGCGASRPLPPASMMRGMHGLNCRHRSNLMPRSQPPRTKM
jgi:hypothetical protein